VNGQRAARQEPLADNIVTPLDDRLSVARLPIADHRERQVRRLAAIALVRSLYGPEADARLAPPGPVVCPPGCPWCGLTLVVAS
jgi:hypothetical protein